MISSMILNNLVLRALFPGSEKSALGTRLDFEIMFDDTKANLELRKLERTH